MNSMVGERERCVRTFVELPVALRPAIEDTIERLMLILDELDGDPDVEFEADFEDEGLDEPSLGALEQNPRPDDGIVQSVGAGDQSRWGWGDTSDCEDEHDGRDAVMGGRFWPAVIAFWNRRYGLSNVEAFSPDGEENLDALG